MENDKEESTMDELKLRLNSRFMRNIISKLITKFIYKKLGYKINIQLNDLDVRVIDGEAHISTNVEAKVDSNEFMRIMKTIGDED